MNNLENLTIPKTKELRQVRLDEAVKTLKTEFVGLDKIIDDIKKSITPWYITPEVIERPVVISLWGLTGTGKTSIVRRLTSLLGLSGKTVFFDCGLEANESSSSSIADKIEEVFGCDDDMDSMSSDYGNTKNAVFVFDEFQYARTIDESGVELIKSPLRPIWTIMDSGKFNTSGYKYDVNRFNNFVEDFSLFAKDHPNISVTNGRVINRDDVMVVLENLGLFYYGRDISSIMNLDKDSPIICCSDDNNDGDEDTLRPLSLIEQCCLRTLVKKLNGFKKGYGFETVSRLNKTTTISEYSNILEESSKIVSKPVELDCSKSLVFILGNLDEAFEVESDIDPDMDADTFYDKTSKVSISDIKEALKRRFRAEQIARLGNNMIKYPSLKREHFVEIIKKELSRIFNRFYETEGITVTCSPGVIELMYSEGVFPVQGVRPVYTTIGTLLTPILSEISINRSQEDKNIEIDLNNKADLTEKRFKINQTELVINFIESGKNLLTKVNLQLGELRNPERRLTRFINSVHEAGHAIVSLYETGEYPVNIVAVSTGSGGFCNTYNSKKEGEIDSREDVDSEVKVCLAGYEAENLVYGDYPGKCLMGSSSDIETAWEFFSGMAYSCGYFEPVSFSNYKVEESTTGIPNGLSDSNVLVVHPYDKTMKLSLQEMIIYRFIELRNDTKSILQQEKKLLKEVSLYLGKNGSMNSEEFKEFVGKYGNKLTEDYIQGKINSNKDWYERILREF